MVASCLPRCPLGDARLVTGECQPEAQRVGLFLHAVQVCATWTPTYPRWRFFFDVALWQIAAERRRSRGRQPAVGVTDVARAAERRRSYGRSSPSPLRGKQNRNIKTGFG